MRLGRAFPTHVIARRAGPSSVSVNLTVQSPVGVICATQRNLTLLASSTASAVLDVIKLKGLQTLSVASATSSILSKVTGKGVILAVTSTTTKSVIKSIRKWVAQGDTPNQQTYVNDVLADSPNHYWRFKEIGNNSNVFYDSINGYFMSTSGGTTKGIGGLIAGCNDYASYFDTTGSGATGVILTPFQGGSFSVEYWTYPFQLGASRFAVAIGTINNASADNFLHIGFIFNNKLRFGFFGDDLDSVQTFSTLTKYHIVCTFDATTKTRKIYVNGVLDVSDTATGALSVPSDASMQVSTVTFATGNGPFSSDAVLAQLALYPSVLSADRVLQHYNDGITGPVASGAGVATTGIMNKGIGKILGTAPVATPLYVLRSRVVLNNFDGGITAPLSATVLEQPSTVGIAPGLFRVAPPNATFKVQFKSFLMKVIRRVSIS